MEKMNDKLQNLLTIVVPCYNEEKNIPTFFGKLLAFAAENGYYVIAVNDGSTDRTAEELHIFADSPGYTVLTHKMNKGYGAAIKTGLEAARTMFAITVDADGQHRLEDVKRCIDFMLEKDADLVVGARKNNQSGNYRMCGKFLIRMFAHSLLDLPVSDLNSGMKCYRLEIARKYLDLCPNTMAFSDVILLLMVNDRNLVTEIPIEVAPRISGKSTIRTKTAIVTITEILNLSVLLRPMTTFFRLGMIFFLMGCGWGIYTYTHSKIISSVVIAFIMLSAFCFVFALIAEQISRIRRSLADREK